MGGVLDEVAVGFGGDFIEDFGGLGIFEGGEDRQSFGQRQFVDVFAGSVEKCGANRWFSLKSFNGKPQALVS